MDFEWDEDKNEKNISKHGIDFNDAMYLWEGVVIEREDPRDYDGETRFVAFGMVDGRVLAVVCTWRGDICRIISARKATRNERKAYDAAFPGFAADPRNH